MPIGHYADGFPIWLASEQVREESDHSTDPERAKTSDADTAKLPTMLLVGLRDLETGAVIRLHGHGNVGVKPKGEVVAEILAAIKERRS